jgi:methylmalonyl-CoA mutase
MAAAIDAFAAGATVAEVADALRGDHGPTRIVPLVAEREAWAFELLRDASDRRLADSGGRPRVFLANMGSIPEHRAHRDFAKNVFEAGGIETISNDGFATVEAAAEAFAGSGAPVAAICASGERMDEVVPGLAAGLKRRGARTVLVAGKPGAEEGTWRSAGVDGFVFAGCDVLAVLEELLSAEGALGGGGQVRDAD